MKQTTGKIAFWLAVCIAAAAMSACSPDAPIRIGFMAGLSGRVADLGVSGRNGVILAIEEINQQGGINGRPVELVVRDDRQDRQAAIEAAKSLLNQDLEVIIGPMTSSMAMAVVPLVSATTALLVSPTVTTTELTGIDDQFIRVIATTRDYASQNARYQYNKLKHRRGAAIYDVGNRAYTETWFDHFKATFETLGGTIRDTHIFKSAPDTVFFSAVEKLLADRPDFLLVLANAVDAGLICQQVRKIDDRVVIVMSEWASTERFLELGGAATEGVYLSQFLDRNDTSARYVRFRESYKKRFGQEPGFAGVSGYDAATVVLEAWTQRKKKQTLKQAILEQGTFQCVQEPITIDPNGDANRSTHMSTIKNSRYITLF